jgi:hypothetical protein
LDPAKVFEKLAKVSAFKVDKAASFKFSQLKAKSGGMRKVAAINLSSAPPSDQEKYAFLKALVKQAKLENKEESWEAIHTLERRIGEELRQVKQAFISESTNFENLIRPFPYLREKYASLIDPLMIDPEIKKVPTARDMVEVSGSMEKISQLAETCSQLSTMYDILKRR